MPKIDLNDIYNLQRFVAAQDPVYQQVCRELSDGHKSSHWMWFIFPQIKGLSSSYMGEKFAISSRAEAQAYLKHQLLGPRLRECTRLVIAINGRSADEIFGYPDNLKFQSSMTLFAHATSDNALFNEALQKYYQGEFDRSTLNLLSQ